MRRECRERERVNHPDMHHDTCVTHVPWCVPGSVTRGFLWSWWRGKRSWHSRRMCSPQFYISGKRHMLCLPFLWIADLQTFNVQATTQIHVNYPDSKVHGANMRPTWALSAPDGPHVGPMNLTIRVNQYHRCWCPVYRVTQTSANMILTACYPTIPSSLRGGWSLWTFGFSMLRNHTKFNLLYVYL